MTNAAKPLIAISSCLLGNRVRYDGDSKGVADIYQHMQQHFELLAICPEVEMGLSVPRPAVQLSGDPHHPSMTGRDDHSIDVTQGMRDFCNTRPHTLKHICAYIFKSRSPSCGIRNIPIYNITMPQQIINHNARGLFAEAMIKYLPELPVADETELNTHLEREHFVQRILDYVEQHSELL